ncbi:MAG: nucleotide sugar dehydrogenase [Bacteroidales bacterium]|jgi:UDP-N-acetyl-D-galactosamine dehydrogenase|nr:nucleotide sugar dehydrogenase [Bacteroidales bacterium]
MNTYNQLINKQISLSVIGLGYVGLPIALSFAKKIKVIGFDIKKDRIELMQRAIDPSGELEKEEFQNCDILFTYNEKDLSAAGVHIIAVPTPIDTHLLPDLTLLLNATQTVGKVLKKGDIVIYESTVYPGCTEEDCVPLLEKTSGLKFNKDFFVGFSPERINPGDKEHTLATVKKIVSASTEQSLEEIAKIYQIVAKAGTFKTSSIKVAEASKIIENTQRDVNIALMNELSMIFNKMSINTFEVLEAAATKWNFLNFKPGLVGGHCIGVDPYYLTFKAKEYRHYPQIIESGRSINDSMGFYIAKMVVKKIISLGETIKDAKVLVMGATFKENVKDIRNTKVVDIVHELQNYGVKVNISDPYADKEEFENEYHLPLTDRLSNDYLAVIVAVNHQQYATLDESYFQSITKEKAVLFDVKGTYRNKIHQLNYMSL